MPGSGGGKTSTSKEASSSPYAGLLAQFAKSFQPAAAALGGQQAEALKTGGVNAQIPIISRSVDAARQAQSKALEGTRESLARSGLSNSSFGQQIMAETQMEGGQNIAQIPTSIAGEFIRGVPQSISSAIGAGQGAGYLTRTETTRREPSFWDLFQQGVESGGAAYGGGP